MERNMGKRIIGILLTLVMLITLVPNQNVFAANKIWQNDGASTAQD